MVKYKLTTTTDRDEKHEKIMGWDEAKLADYSAERHSTPWNPKTWRRRVWLWLGSGVILIVVVVVGAVVGVRATRQSNESLNNGPYPYYFRIYYDLADTYSPSDFLSHFNYVSGEDPAEPKGFVQYTAQEEAVQRNLTYVTNTIPSTVIIRADNTAKAPNGRQSVRLESKKKYGPGLFIFDIKKTPYGCGLWPILGLADPSNPENGRIDVMENPSSGGWNWPSIHTGPGCSMRGVRREMTGLESSHECNETPLGCFSLGTTIPPYIGGENTFGRLFNDQGGGLIALEYRLEGIRIWKFVRTEIPYELRYMGNGLPDPSTWGPPQADFPNTKCDIGRHFRNQRIVINVNFCGIASTVFNWKTDECGKELNTSCEQFVADNSTAFGNALWEFGEFKMYRAVSS